MKELLLLRHGKSSWAHPDMDDHDRPLNDRGLHDAPRAGRWLLEKDLLPGRIFSSSAKRAESTAKIVARACNTPEIIEIIPELYLAEVEDHFRFLRTVSPEWTRVMIVAHNPGLEELVAKLTGQSPAMPTAALAHIILPIADWADLVSGIRGTLENLWYPKGARD